MILEDSVISFLPKVPHKDARDENPSVIENLALIGIPIPLANCSYDIPMNFALLLASETHFFSNSARNLTGMHEMLNRFLCLSTERKNRGSMIISLPEIVPCEDLIAT